MIRAALSALDRVVAVGCKWTVIACFIGLFALLSLGMLQRMMPLFNLAGYDELIELLFVWLTFVGSLALWREGALYRVDAADRLLAGRARQVLAALTHLAMLGIASMLAVKGWDFLRQSGETTPFLQIDKAYWYAAIPSCGLLMSFYSIAAIWRAFRGDLRAPGSVATLG